MKKQTRDALLLSLIILAAAASLYFSMVGRPPKIDLGTYAALGAGTAEETAKLLGTKGKVLVIVRDTGADKNPSVETELAAFQQTLKRHKGLSLTTARFVATPMEMMATGGSVPADQLAKTLQTHANLNALVLFCGFPALGDTELATLKKRGIQTVVVASFRPDYGPLLKQGVLHRVIVPRPEPPAPDAPTPRTPRELFDQDYAIVTAADLTP